MSVQVDNGFTVKSESLDALCVDKLQYSRLSSLHLVSSFPSFTDITEFYCNLTHYFLLKSVT